MKRILDYFKVLVFVALFWLVSTMAIGSSIDLYRTIKSDHTKIEYLQSKVDYYEAHYTKCDSIGHNLLDSINQSNLEIYEAE